MLINRDLIKEINQLTRSSPFYAKLSQPKYHNLKGYIDQESVTFQLARQLFSYQSYNGSFLVEDFTNKQALIVLNEAYNHGFKSFWLSEKLFEAFCHSQFPQNLVEFIVISNKNEIRFT